MDIKTLRECTGMNRKEFSIFFNIPYRTVENWETNSTNKRICPSYLLELMIYKLEKENKIKNWRE